MLIAWLTAVILLAVSVGSWVYIRRQSADLAYERARFDASVGSLNLGFLMTDKKGLIVSLNSAARWILCSTHPGAGVIQNIRMLNSNCTMAELNHHLESIYDLRQYIQQTLAKNSFLVDEIALNGKFFRLFLSPIALPNKKGNEVVGAVAVLEDVTDAKLLERSKEEFFSIASHELRTPLTAIRGNTALIQQYYSEVLRDPSLKEMISDIHVSSVRLIELVNDFLDTSRLEQNRMEFKKETFSLAALTQEVFKEVSPLAREKGLYLQISPYSTSASVTADHNRTKQVMINLIGNALKFTDHGGVTVQILTQPDQLAKVLIIDTGRGIPMDSQNLLFKKFQQASNSLLTRDATRGTGLGLYISKLMIEGMGGRIAIESTQEHIGTTFSFTLPLAGS